MIDIRTPAFLADSVCASTDPALFFPEQGNSPKPAKTICGQCPATTECLEWAVSEGILHGIFGGLTGYERRALRQCRRCSSLAAPGSKFCDNGCREISRAETKRAYGRRQPKAVA